MTTDDAQLEFRPGQRWGFFTRCEEFQRELVILGSGKNPAVGPFYEVAVPFALEWQEAPPDLDGTLLAVTPEGLQASVVELIEDDVAPSDVRHAMRLPGCVSFTEGTVDDGLGEYLAAVRFEARQRREAGGRTIVTAIEEGDLDEVRRLVDEDPAVLGRPMAEECPDPPLGYAAWQGQTEVVRFLLERGAGADARGDAGMTPLHYAAREGQPEIARLLLDHGAEAGIRDASGFTPIFTAARGRRPDCVRVAELLEDHGAEVDLNTLVCLGRAEETGRRLEADRDACRKARFPQLLAEDMVASIQWAVLLRSVPGIEDREAIDAVVAEYLPVLERMLEAGADPNAGYPLFTAVQLPDTRVAGLLLARGADPNKDVDQGCFMPELARRDDVKALLAEFGAASRDDPEQVILRESAALEENPEDVEALKRRAAACRQSGRYGAALADYETAIQLAPEDPEAYNERAWIWATCPDEALRDGPRAVQSAARAVELDGGSALLWDEQAGRVFFRCRFRETLAAAHAETGDFEAAVAVIDESLALASPPDRPRLLYRRKLFASGIPYRDEPGADDPALYEGIEDPFAEKRPGLLRRLFGFLKRVTSKGS